MRVPVAFVQTNWPEMDRETNRRQVAAALEQAVVCEAQVLALPELWCSGYDLARVVTERSWGEEFELLQELSTRGVSILGGSVPEWREDCPRPANCAVAYEGGRELTRYRKTHLFSPLGETDYLEAGCQPPEIFRIAGLRAACAICYDLRFPELFRPLGRSGVDLIYVAAQWPDTRIEHWRALLTARAIENQCYVLGVNRLGRYGETQFGGHSMLVTPWGEIQLDTGEQEGFFRVELDLEAVAQARERLPVQQDSRVDLF